MTRPKPTVLIAAAAALGLWHAQVSDAQEAGQSPRPAESGTPALPPPMAAPAPPPMAAPAPPAVAPAPAMPSPAPGADDARYTFYRVQDSFVRLDSRTGQVSLCRHGGASWTCQAAPEERAALESEIGRLQRDNAVLKKELLARGVELPGGLRDPTPPPTPPVARAPDTEPRGGGDSEVERVRAFLERVWRRLVEMVAEIQRDMQRKS